jgi:hypothetical protein
LIHCLEETMMEQLKELPIGVQTFEEIIKDDLLYVDKTSFIEEMISRHGPKAWFLSRPRRFGKSLTVSTLKALCFQAGGISLRGWP